MYSFNPAEQGVGEHIQELLQLFSRCIADMVVVSEHSPMPDYCISTPNDFNVLTVTVPHTTVSPDRALSFEYNYNSRVLSINIDKIPPSFVTILIPKDNPDARCIKEEAHTRLMIIQAMLMNINRTRQNKKDVKYD